MLRAPRASSDIVPHAIPAGSAETIANCDDLRFSSDAERGITRRRAGSGFFYVQPNGQRVSDEATLARIRKLAIPPAYRDVWICRDADGHLQATGIDARGRKQYRYHERWRSVRDEHKFERMMGFGRALPKIHRRIARDMKLPGMPREKVLATVVRLLERTLIRIGNDEYARTNKSYGLTTLRNRHVKLNGDRVKFSFRGKHGIRHEVQVEAPRVAKILRKCLDLPGQDLFEYVDADGHVRDVTSSDVNQYLREITGEPYTAKDFRTWHATVEVLEMLTGQPFTTARESRAKLKEALQTVAQRLGNTPTMCRKCYVNPVVVDAFLAGELRDRALKGGGDERVRLLHLLTRTPSGVAFKRVPSKRASPKAVHRHGSISRNERLNLNGRRVRTHA
jgi:DNA topoisomerase-1